MRNKSKVRISFFSFQDIITSTTGILLLIILILTFFLKTGGEAASGTKSQKELQALINQHENAIKDAQRKIDELTPKIEIWTGVNKKDLIKNINELKGRLDQLKGKLANLNDKQKQSLDLAEKKAKLIRALKELQDQITMLEGKLAKLKKERSRVNAANQLFVIPEPALGKKFILIVVAGAEMEVFTFDPGQIQKRTFRARTSLLKHLKTKRPVQSYQIVFLVKPSGTDNFDALHHNAWKRNERSAVQKLGFTRIGWDPLEEHKTLNFN